MAKETSIIDLLDAYEPQVKAAFMAAIREITSKARLADIVRALERGDINAAVEAVTVDKAAFGAFVRELEAVYGAGGISTIDGLGRLRDASGANFVVRFDARNIRAENWLRDVSGNLITRIVDEQRDNIRRVMQEGMEAGNNPRNVALDIVGRMDGATKRRTGGIVGLSEPQERAVANARKELTEGKFAEYLQRARRDKRFDVLVRKAMENGKPLTVEQVVKAINRYSDRLLLLRGQTIARTEMLASLHAAQHEALLQLVDTGKISVAQIVRKWDATGDKRTRFDHAVADGQGVGLNERFKVGGKYMLYPGDPAGGAEQVINCRCAVRVKVDFFAGVT